MILILEDAEAVGYLHYLAARETGRPRFEAGGEHLDSECLKRMSEAAPTLTPGRCRHYDSAGTLTVDGDGPSPREDRPLCTYGWECPHLDTPDIGCPVTEALSSMREVAQMREACEREQGIPVIDEQTGEVVCYTPRPIRGPPPEADAVPRSDYVLTPQGPGPDQESVIEPSLTAPDPQARKGVPRAKEWNRDEDAAMMGATSPGDAVRMYRAVYPDSDRSDAAIKTRYHTRIKKIQPTAEGKVLTSEALPDFAGDQAPITQCEELPEGDAPAFDAEEMDDGAAEPAVSSGPRPTGKLHPWIGMRVRVLDPGSGLRGCTGLVRSYNSSRRELLIDLDSSGTIWIAPESLMLIGAGRAS